MAKKRSNNSSVASSLLLLGASIAGLVVSRKEKKKQKEKAEAMSASFMQILRDSYLNKYDGTDKWLEKSPYFIIVGRFCTQKKLLNREEIAEEFELCEGYSVDVVKQLQKFGVVEVNKNDDETVYIQSIMTPEDFENEFGKNNHRDNGIYNTNYIFEKLKENSIDAKRDSDDTMLQKIGLYCCKKKHTNVFEIEIQFNLSHWNAFKQLCILQIDGVISIDNYNVFRVSGPAAPTITSLLDEREIREKYNISNEINVKVKDVPYDNDIVLIDSYIDDERISSYKFESTSPISDEVKYDRINNCESNGKDKLFYEVGKKLCENSSYDDLLKCLNEDRIRLNHILMQLMECGIIKFNKKSNGKLEIKPLWDKFNFDKVYSKRYKYSHNMFNLLGFTDELFRLNYINELKNKSEN